MEEQSSKQQGADLHELVHDGDLIVDVHGQLVAVHQQAVGRVLQALCHWLVGQLLTCQRPAHVLQASRVLLAAPGEDQCMQHGARLTSMMCLYRSEAAR